jgi:hypothetical protein
MYTQPVPCRFPGCDHTAPLVGADDADSTPLCFDHRELLFYDEAEFDRLWRDRDVDN